MTEKKRTIFSYASNAVRNFLTTPSTVLPEENKENSTDFGKVKVIPWYSGYNKFVRILVLMSEHANTHRRCIYTKADAVISDGFDIVQGRANSSIKTKSSVQKQSVSEDVIKATIDFADIVNNDGDSLAEIGRKCIINYEGTGTAFCELIKGENDGTKFYKIYNQDSERCLYAEPEVEGGNPTHVYISESWDENYIRNHTPRKLPIFPQWEEINGAQRCIIVMKNFSMGRDYYPLPTFIAAFLAGRSEYESDRHNLDGFYRDFKPDVFAQFFAPDGMTEEEKQEFSEDFINTYTNRNREDPQNVFVQVVESEAMKANIQQFNKNGKEGEFIKLKDDSRQSVFTAHGWHPVLAGVPVTSGMGDSKQLENIFKIYNRLTTRPLQVALLDQIINPIFKDAAEWLNAPFKMHSLTLETTSPIGLFDQIDVNSITQVKEARQRLGLTPGDDTRYVSEVTASAKETVPPTNGNNG